MNKITIIVLAIPIILLTAMPLSLPETPRDLKEFGKSILYGFPELLKGVWYGFLDVLQIMWGWMKGFFNTFFAPFFQRIWEILQNIWQERKRVFYSEIKKEAPLLEEIKTLIFKFPKNILEKIKSFSR